MLAEYDFDHARRVAARVIGYDAKLVAMLHDAVEDGVITEDELAETVGDAGIFKAILLLTRTHGVTYMDYIRQIYVADGYVGYLARAVKIADLTENLGRMDDAHEHNRAKYEAALELLKNRPAVLPRVLT